MRVVNSLDELLTLPQDRNVNGLRSRTPVRLEIPALTRPVLIRAQYALNELQERGGSLVAAACMFATLVVGVAKVLHRNASMLDLRALMESAIVLAGAFAAGAVGRYVAMTVTRWQFTQRCRAQHRTLSRQLR